MCLNLCQFFDSICASAFASKSVTRHFATNCVLMMNRSFLRGLENKFFFFWNFHDFSLILQYVKSIILSYINKRQINMIGISLSKKFSLRRDFKNLIVHKHRTNAKGKLSFFFSRFSLVQNYITIIILFSPLFCFITLPKHLN